ncbi:MAG: DUF1353 domain-containing protein [Colwellia sp.]
MLKYCLVTAPLHFLGFVTTILLYSYILLAILFKGREGKLKEKPSLIEIDKMPVMRPIPIPTSSHKHWLDQLLAFVFLIRRWRIEEAFSFTYKNEAFLIPAGFEFDGTSIPRPLWALLSPTGLLLIPALIHEYGYRYNCIYTKNSANNPVLTHHNKNQEFWDKLFCNIGNQVNGVPLLNALVKFDLALGGRCTWANWRKKNLQAPDFKWTMQEGHTSNPTSSSQVALSQENSKTPFKSGSTKTTQIGYENLNKQKVHGTRKVKGNDHNQFSYKIECLHCGEIYGANGTDIHRRKCPECQKGKAGLEY